jgi:hypothetical protein
MRYQLSTILSCPPERCVAELRRPALLAWVAQPFVQFTPIAPTVWPEEWEERQYRVSMRLFGVVPLGWQIIDITTRADSTARPAFEMRDNGRGALIRVWDHRIKVEPMRQGCRYTDRIEIDAGLLTPAIWLFAVVFYRHRQRRWRRLVSRNFAAD